VLEAPFDVERAPVRAGELPGREEIDADPDEGDDEDDRPARLRRRDEATDGAVDDQAGEDEQRGAVRLRREDLGAAQPERPVPARGLSREAQHDERHGERACVGEHVRCVGEERERMGEDPGGHLAGHEGDDQRKRDRQAARVVAAAVRVPMRMLVHRTIMPPDPSPRSRADLLAQIPRLT